MVQIGPAGYLFLLIALVALPALAIRSRIDLEHLGTLPRAPTYRMVITQQLVLLVVALLAAWLESRPVAVGRTDPIVGLVSAAMLAAILALLRPVWRRKAAAGEPGLLHLAPRTGSERSWWIAMSTVVGVSEEIFWRGVTLAILTTAVGSIWLAAVIVSAAFGLAHAAQGRSGILTASLMSLLLSALVIWTEGLLMAMILHAIYDTVAGLDSGRVAAGTS